jgi:hypothetical protein
MTSAMRCRPVSWIAAALLALPACATRDIYPNPFSGPIAPSNTNVGEMEILLAPFFDTYDAAVNAPWTMPESRYYVFLDGSQWLVDGGNGRSIPVTLYDNYEGSIGFLAAGSHHFQINAVVGGATVFEGDVNIPGGSVTRLYLVGSLDKARGPLRVLSGVAPGEDTAYQRDKPRSGWPADRGRTVRRRPVHGGFTTARARRELRR